MCGLFLTGPESRFIFEEARSLEVLTPELLFASFSMLHVFLPGGIRPTMKDFGVTDFLVADNLEEKQNWLIPKISKTSQSCLVRIFDGKIKYSRSSKIGQP